MNTTLSKNEEMEKFASFLAEVNYLPDFLIQRAKEKGITLDYNTDSLNNLEKYLIDQKVTKDDEDFQLASMYLGELMIKNFGGEWVLCIEDPREVDYGFPIIKGHSKLDVAFNPFHVIKSFILRKNSGQLLTAVNADINPTPLDLSEFPEE